MANLKSALVFVLQSIVVGLAVAFLVVLVRPDLMPGIAGSDAGPASYADAVSQSAASVANIYTKRLVQSTDALTDRARFRVDTAFASAVGLSLFAAHPQDEWWDFEIPAENYPARSLRRAVKWFRDNW